MRKNCFIFALFCAMFVITAVQTDKAYGLEPHYTDGTTFQGSVNYGPPPVIEKQEECGVWLLDPPTYTYLTVHFIENGVEFASQVVPYFAQNGSIPSDVSSIVTNHEGTAYLTWNIGTGQSPTIKFNCVPPSTTSTTISTTTTLQPTTTSSSSSTTSTTTGSASVEDPSTTTTVAPFQDAGQLPKTGSGLGEETALGLSVVGIGSALAFAKKRRSV